MKITITGKELKATEAIKDYVEKKLTRIEKYFEGTELDANVTIKAEKNVKTSAKTKLNRNAYSNRAKTSRP